MEIVGSTDDAETLRAAQAVLLPLLGYSLEDCAKVVGRSRFWVSRARGRLMRGQKPPIKHGGRRRALAKPDDEVALVRKALVRLYLERLDELRLRASLADVLAEHTDRPVSESTITNVLKRVAPKMLEGGTLGDLSHGCLALARFYYFQELVSRITGKKVIALD